MEEGALASWVAYAGLAALLAIVVGEWRRRGVFGERPTAPPPDTRVLLLLAVGAWLISQIVVLLLIENVSMTAPVRLFIAVGAHVAVALLVLRPLLAMSPRAPLAMPAQVGAGAVGGLATFGVVFLASIAVVALYGVFGIAADEIPKQDVVETLGSVSIAGRVMIVFAACVMAPFAEEVFYRGVLLPALAQKLSVSLALVVQALVFGFVHFWADPFMWPLSLPLAAVGWCAGWIYVRTGSLRAATVLHMVFNAVQVALFFATSSA